MQYIIGVDLGTQATKAGICDENGTVLGSAAVESKLLYPEEGAVEQDPEEMLASVLSSIKEVVQASGIHPGRVAAICIDGQMAGITGVGPDGKAVIPYDSWLDTRCGSYRQPFIDYGEERVIRLTGTPVTYAHGPKILWWKTQRPEQYKKIYKFVQPAAYCTMRMCGLKGDETFIDHTYLHFSGFADTQRREWSPELLSALEVDENKMPKIRRSFDTVGRLIPDMALACGLPPGIPMVAGCGDTVASAFGAGVIKSGTLLDIAGTASVLCCAADVYAPDVKHKTLLYAPSVLEDLYYPMAYINGGGMCLKWLRDDVLSGQYTYSELNEMAAGVQPGSGNLFFLPHFSGRVCPNDTLVRGGYFNLSWTQNAASLYRAILEGISYEYGIYANIIHELIPDLTFSNVISVGGGAKSRLFRQIKADVLGTPVSAINQTDTALLGCCAIAGYAVDLFPYPESLIEKVVQPDKTENPDPTLYSFYQQRVSVYASCIEELHTLYGKIGML